MKYSRDLIWATYGTKLRICSYISITYYLCAIYTTDHELTAHYFHFVQLLHRYYTLTGIRNGDVIVVGLVHLRTGCPRKECRTCGKVMKSSSYAWSEVSAFSWLIIRVLCAASLISWFI